VHDVIHVRIAIGTVLAAATALAQAIGGVPPPPGTVLPASTMLVNGRIGPMNRVTGQPFSAQEETESVQTLSDGTHINSGPRKVTYYRDSLGRTRTERTPAQPPGLAAAAMPPVFIDIEDPVGGYRYTLDSNSHTAHRTPIAPARAANGQQIFAATAPAYQPGTAIESGRRQGDSSAVTAAPAKRGNPRPRPETSTEQLGAETLEGVSVDGIRTTTTWPVGYFGNDRPIRTVRETWTSRALGMALLTKSSDPRSGESTTRLTNILQAEPDASLFLPPAGYEMVDPPVQK
jgi:hypothetical protein